MTLHSILSGAIGHTCWWYAAIPRSRPGKVHILRVPYWAPERDKIQVPSWNASNAERYRDNKAKPHVPSSVYGDATEYRVCTSRQRASNWRITPYIQTLHGRGVCADCIRWQQAAGLTAMGFPSLPENAAYGPRYERQVHAYAPVQPGNENEWVERLKRAWYEAR